MPLKSLLLIATRIHPTRVVITTTRLPTDNSLDLSVKTRSTRLRMPGSGSALAKHDLDFFKCLAAGLRVGEEGLHGGTKAEHAEDNECFVSDVGKGRS
jgi:hypothetical protein